MTEHSTPPIKRVTVIDVARAAGVSAGTVSNSISGKRKVDEATRKRIETAIKDLGYRPNLAARRMRTGQTNTIAIFSSMPVAVAAGPSKLGFLMEIAASAAVTALERNTALILVPPIENPIEAFESIAMDGALVVEPDENDPVLKLLQLKGVPTVCIGKPVGFGCAYVDLDYGKIANILIDHLLEAGAKHFPLIVGSSARQGNLAFKEAYLAACTAACMEPTIVEVPEDDAEEAAARAVSSLIGAGQTFDGVLVPTDAMATGVMRALHKNGLAVPDDVRVATRYDGFRARTENPPLTAVDLKLEVIAALATNKLSDIIEGTSDEQAVSGPLPTLIVRSSSSRN